VALDEANEMSFPASDPVNTSNITRITKAPVLPEAAADHQNSNKIKTAAKKPPISKTVSISQRQESGRVKMRKLRLTPTSRVILSGSFNAI